MSEKFWPKRKFNKCKTCGKMTSYREECKTCYDNRTLKEEFEMYGKRPSKNQSNKTLDKWF